LIVEALDPLEQRRRSHEVNTRRIRQHIPQVII
jgi:hypothetical protein